MSDYINELTDLFDAFSSFTESMKKATRNDMLCRHPNYRERVKELEEKEKKVENVLNECSEECKQIIYEYIIDLKDLHHNEGDYFYMRGYSDCMRLLNRFNILK